jgi:dipeptidyl aminopeptidase/acylaminoacyl peptidase
LARNIRTGLFKSGIAAVLVCLALCAPAGAAFPGANGKIVFTRAPSFFSGTTDIYVVNPDGTGETRLTNNSVFDINPAWSADGRKIAFSRLYASGTREGDIYVMNADGSGETRLTSTQDDDIAPTWSPDGKKIAFMRGSFIYMMNSDGSDPTPFVEGKSPAWSPDGKKIAYAQMYGSYHWTQGIRVINVDGTGDTPLAAGDSINGGPTWSPDGQQIAFVGVPQFVFWPGQIYVVNADGTSEVKLSPDPTDSGPQIVDRSPTWAPEGGKLAFSRQLFEFCCGPLESGLFTISPDGSGLSKVTDGYFGSLDWQPLNRPPRCADAIVVPAVLAVPNHSFQPVAISVPDPDGDQVDARVSSVTQDEPLTGRAGDKAPDARRSSEPNQVFLRSERDPLGDGRVYRVSFDADDGEGGTCSGSVTVSVPHDLASTAVDSVPPSYNSFGS